MGEENNGPYKDKIKDKIILETAINITPSKNLGVSQTYDRAKYDNIYKRSKFKEEYFRDKKTSIDYITGETLHLDTNAARNKYGRKNYTKHTADIDHIIPEKRVHKKLKNNPFLSDYDVKIIANDKANYRVTQSAMNRSKKDKTNIEYIKTNNLESAEKIKMVGDHFKAETAITLNSSIKSTVNAGNEFKTGAKNSLEASAVPIMVEGVHNIILVASGEKEFEEAAKDMGKLTRDIAVTGGVIQITTTALTSFMKNSKSKQLNKIANSNQVAQVISVALVVKDSVIKFINGEIDGEQFFYEIGEKGVGLIGGAIGFEIGKDVGFVGGALIGQVLIPIPGVGMAVGATVGAAVGAFLGSMIISVACTEVYKYVIKLNESFKSVNEYKNHLARLNNLAEEALSEMEYQRNILKSLMGEQFSKWDEEFNLGFDLILDSALVDDYEGISAGVNSILNVLGESVRFKTLEEFDDFFMNEDAVFTF